MLYIGIFDNNAGQTSILTYMKWFDMYAHLGELIVCYVIVKVCMITGRYNMGEGRRKRIMDTFSLYFFKDFLGIKNCLNDLSFTLKA